MFSKKYISRFCSTDVNTSTLKAKLVYLDIILRAPTNSPIDSIIYIVDTNLEEISL